MSCEHPACSSKADVTCLSHCHLSICHKHRLEHENHLYDEIQKQLDDLSNPLSTLISQIQQDLRQSEELHQRELNRINSHFDLQQSSIDQRLKLTKQTNELLSKKREQLNQHKTGDKQLTKEDYLQLEWMLNQINKNLHEHEHNHHIDTQTINNHRSTSEMKQTNSSTTIECIEILDSDDDVLLPNTIDVQQTNRTSTKVEKTRTISLNLLRDICPLTKYGVFGLENLQNIKRFCSNENRTSVYLYIHFIRTHHIKPYIATQLVRAIRSKCNPMETKIFPQINHNIITKKTFQCPFNKNAMKFNEENSIPKTPCCSLIEEDNFQKHLGEIHSITKANIDLIYNAMKHHGTISHVQFEEDLCE
ncbi:hypothetical protein I4U23_006946 [Adineta vaga]|nr:hypothetical protein I4U23_006946 [Adineta vaga]